MTFFTRLSYNFTRLTLWFGIDSETFRGDTFKELLIFGSNSIDAGLFILNHLHSTNISSGSSETIMELDMVGVVTHDGVTGTELRLEDDKFSNLGNAGGMDGGPISSNEKINCSAFSVQLGLKKMTIGDFVLDVPDTEAWILGGQFRNANSVDLVTISIDVNDCEAEELTGHPGSGTISADQNERDVLAMEIESLGKVIGDKAVLGAVVEHCVGCCSRNSDLLDGENGSSNPGSVHCETAPAHPQATVTTTNFIPVPPVDAVLGPDTDVHVVV